MSFNCILCGVAYFRTEEDWKTHCAGKKHGRKVRAHAKAKEAKDDTKCVEEEEEEDETQDETKGAGANDDISAMPRLSRAETGLSYRYLIIQC